MADLNTDDREDRIYMRRQLGEAKPLSSGATKIFYNDMRLAVTDSARSYEFVAELDVPPSVVGMVAPILAQAGADTPALAVSMLMISDLTDLDSNNFAAAKALTFDSGAASTALFNRPPTVTEVGISRPDLATLAHVARTGGATRCLIAARTYATATNGFWNGGSGSTIVPWATRSAGLVRTRRNSGAGDQRTATANWSASEITPVVGFEYTTTVPVMDYAPFGDSQDYGAATIRGESAALLACDAINSDLAGVAYISHSNRAWPGQDMDAIVQHVVDYHLSGFRPHVIGLPIGSQNSVVSGFSGTNADELAAKFEKAVGVTHSYGGRVVARAMLPAPFDQFAWGSAGDAVRLAYNDRMQAACAVAGIPFIAVRPEFIGPVDGNGQQTMAAAYSDDTVHLNAAGLALWAADYETAILEAARGVI